MLLHQVPSRVGASTWPRTLQMAATAAISPRSQLAADSFMKAWTSRQWIDRADDFPAAPPSVQDMYETHLAMQQSAYADELGSLGGYKIGAVGAEGEPCLYGPLFNDFLVEAAGRPGAKPLSSAAINLFQVEPEFAVVMAEDLPPRADGQPHDPSDVWSKVASVVLCIEACGRRGTSAVASTLGPLGRFHDGLCAGGVVLGPRRAAKYFAADSLASVKTELLLNGEIVATGSGAALPFGGSVETGLAWLANHLNARGLSLRAGHLVATGQTCIYNGDLVPGDRVVARFETLGEVEMVVEP